jgi:hypothetical protein
MNTSLVQQILREFTTRVTQAADGAARRLEAACASPPAGSAVRAKHARRKESAPSKRRPSEKPRKSRTSEGAPPEWMPQEEPRAMRSKPTDLLALLPADIRNYTIPFSVVVAPSTTPPRGPKKGPKRGT